MEEIKENFQLVAGLIHHPEALLEVWREYNEKMKAELLNLLQTNYPDIFVSDSRNAMPVAFSIEKTSSGKPSLKKMN